MQPITGLTEEQDALVRAALSVLANDADVEAVWLAGSLGRGRGDAFSDVDLLVLARSSASELGKRYVGEVVRIATPVLVMPLFGARVVSVVTEDWRRFDLTFIEGADLEHYDGAALIELHNAGSRAPAPRPPAVYSPSGDAVLALINEFLRILGLSVVAVGRKEWLLAQRGADLLRGLTMDLMLEENGISPAERGGALRRRPFLTEAQRTALEQLTPVTADLSGVLVSNVELAALFLPRARALAARMGADWPAAFEAATRRRLLTGLGLELP